MLVVSSSCVVLIVSLIHCHAGEFPEVFWENNVKFEGNLARNPRFGASKSHKMGGHFRVLRDKRNTLEAYQRKRVVFSWQAQHFAMRRFALAWQAQHFVACPQCFFHESQCEGCTNMTQCQKPWHAQLFVTALKSCGSLAKNNTFGAL